MKNNEKKLILSKYKENLYKILTYENLLLNNKDYEFLNNFLLDLIIINYDNLIIKNNNDNVLQYNFINTYNIYRYLENKYNYKNDKKKIKKNFLINEKNFNKYLINDIKEIINKVKYNNENEKIFKYQYENLFYYFIIEILKNFSNYLFIYEIKENNFNSIKRNMKNIIKDL